MLEDSGLRSAWDEICVQIQGQESSLWETAYVPTIEQLIAQGVEKLNPIERRAIWLQTPDGEDWLEKLEEDHGQSTHRSRDVSIPLDDGAVTTFILSNVLAMAADCENARIRTYLDRPSLLDEPPDA
jgi:hypothetical protein